MSDGYVKHEVKEGIATVTFHHPKSNSLPGHVLRGMAKRIGGRMPIIGVGGIVEGGDAAAKVDAGATLVQFYTGMVFRGPALIGECVEAIRARGAARAA